MSESKDPTEPEKEWEEEDLPQFENPHTIDLEVLEERIARLEQVLLWIFILLLVCLGKVFHWW